MSFWSRASYKVGPQQLVSSAKHKHLFRGVTKAVAQNCRKHGLTLYSDSALAGMRRAGKVAANALQHVATCGVVKPGASTKQVSEECERYIRDSGLIASSKGYRGFPAALCTSTAEVACHGIPANDSVLFEGDLLAMDVTVLEPVSGFHGDTCYTMYVGSGERMEVATARFLLLSQMTRDIGVFAAMQNSDTILKLESDSANCRKLNEIGIAIENHVSSANLLGKRTDANWNVWTLTEYTGHGIGLGIHESPTVYHSAVSASHSESQIPLMAGMCFTIEPILCLGPKSQSFVDEFDKWSVIVPNTRSAQFEHMLFLKENGQLEVLTVPDNVYPDAFVDCLIEKDIEWLTERYPHIVDFRNRGVALDSFFRQTVASTQ